MPGPPHGAEAVGVQGLGEKLAQLVQSSPRAKGKLLLNLTTGKLEAKGTRRGAAAPQAAAAGAPGSPDSVSVHSGGAEAEASEDEQETRGPVAVSDAQSGSLSAPASPPAAVSPSPASSEGLADVAEVEPRPEGAALADEAASQGEEAAASSSSGQLPESPSASPSLDPRLARPRNMLAAAAARPKARAAGTPPGYRPPRPPPPPTPGWAAGSSPPPRRRVRR
ncbi:unnamed protein product, partial [Prorocentrum cordatum]